MGIFQWFDTGKIDELAQVIAAEVVKRVPPSALESRTKKEADWLINTHNAVFARAGKFARTHKLNIYKKARLDNQFQWALREAGYLPEIVESWTYGLVTLIALSARAGKGPGR